MKPILFQAHCLMALPENHLLENTVLTCNGMKHLGSHFQHLGVHHILTAMGISAFRTLAGGGDLFMAVDEDLITYYLYDPYDPNNIYHHGQWKNIPENQDINQTWTASYYGWLYVYLQPLKPLGGGDTLIIEYGSKYWDILKTTSGLWDSLYLPTGQTPGFAWGRGLRDLRSDNHLLTGNVLGDPYKTRDTIKY